jgi:hypothetical protein
LPTFAVEVNCGLRGARVCPAGPTPHHGPRSLTPTAVAGRVEAPRLWGASKLRLRLVRARRVHQRALSAHGNELQAESYPGSPDLRQIEHGGRPPGIFSAKAAPGTISVPTTIRVAAIAFFNSSSPVFASLGGRYSSGSTVSIRPPVGAAYTARNGASYTARISSSQVFSGSEGVLTTLRGRRNGRN